MTPVGPPTPGRYRIRAAAFAAAALAWRARSTERAPVAETALLHAALAAAALAALILSRCHHDRDSRLIRGPPA
jgi:hypothetical protein